MKLIKEQKEIARSWFEKLRDEICIVFESIENDVEGANEIMAMSPGHFKRKNWERPEGLKNGVVASCQLCMDAYLKKSG